MIQNTVGHVKKIDIIKTEDSIKTYIKCIIYIFFPFLFHVLLTSKSISKVWLYKQKNNLKEKILYYQ